jgi:hypothetical protein
LKPIPEQCPQQGDLLVARSVGEQLVVDRKGLGEETGPDKLSGDVEENGGAIVFKMLNCMARKGGTKEVGKKVPD